MFTPTPAELHKERVHIKAEYPEMADNEALIERWARDELYRRWRAEREYDHTEVRYENPETDSLVNRENPRVLVIAHTAPADGKYGQGWVTRLSTDEARELRDQLNALLSN